MMRNDYLTVLHSSWLDIKKTILDIKTIMPNKEIPLKEMHKKETLPISFVLRTTLTELYKYVNNLI